jgi:hypothetical protein
VIRLLLRARRFSKQKSLAHGSVGDIAEVAAGGDRLLQMDQLRSDRPGLARRLYLLAVRYSLVAPAGWFARAQLTI